MHKNCNRYQIKGFTLIEVVLVIAILGLLSTVAVPNFKNTLAKYKLEMAAKELAQNIQLAQQKAITRGNICKIVLDLHKKDNYMVLSGGRGKMIKLPPGVYFDWTTYYDVNNTIVFNPTGAPNRGGTVAITNGKDTLYVIVLLSTGRVRIGHTPP